MKPKAIQPLLTHSDPAVRELAQEALRLRSAIETHRAQTGHALCWLNDVELWKAIGEDEGAAYPHETLPVREEFLKQCGRFYESRLTGTPYVEPQPKQTLTGTS